MQDYDFSETGIPAARQEGFAEGEHTQFDEDARSGRAQMVGQVNAPAGSVTLLVLERNGGGGNCPPQPFPANDGRNFSKKYISQTTDVSNQVLFTPPEDGLYGVTVAAFAKTAGTQTMSAMITYTTPNGTTNCMVSIDPSSPPNFSFASTWQTGGPVALLSNTPIMVNTQGGPYGSGAFDIFFAVQRLA